MSCLLLVMKQMPWQSFIFATQNFQTKKQIEETKEAESKGDKPELEENARITLEELMASAWELSDDRASLCNGADWLFDERAWICDGQCGRRYGNHTDSNVCRYCLVDLCEEDCVTFLEKGSD